MKKDDRFIETPVTESIRRHVIWTIGHIRNIIKGEKLPPAKPSGKCKSCGHRGFAGKPPVCPDYCPYYPVCISR